MERIVHPENLREAFLRASRGKTEKKEVRRFRENLDAELESIARRLMSGEYQFDSYHFFTIYDPKKRQICAAPFTDRVTFHAMMRICHPVFHNFQIFDSYASRKGKGQYQALERARQFAGKYRWFAKPVELLDGTLCEKEFLTRMKALTAFVSKADSRSFRQKVYSQEKVFSTEQALTA